MLFCKLIVAKVYYVLPLTLAGHNSPSKSHGTVPTPRPYANMYITIRIGDIQSTVTKQTMNN